MRMNGIPFSVMTVSGVGFMLFPAYWARSSESTDFGTRFR